MTTFAQYRSLIHFMIYSLSLILTADWLIKVAPNYYDMQNFPQCEARRQLENIITRIESRQYREGF